MSRSKDFATATTVHSGLGISIPKPSYPQLRPPIPFNASTPRPALVQPPKRAASSTSSSLYTSTIPLRSIQGMNGLLEAENGGSMLLLDPTAKSGSGFKVGGVIVPGFVTPKQSKSSSNFKTFPSNVSLDRHPTLLTRDASPQRNAAELKTILGSAASGKLHANATVAPPSGSARIKKRVLPVPTAPAPVALEQAKSRARVELDILLESIVYVEGGYISGLLVIRIRKARKGEGEIWLADGKVRIVGLEGTCCLSCFNL